MKTDCLFSIIIPNWNGKHHLPECFSSLQGQSFHNFELIIVDNGSSDNSVSYIHQMWPEVCVLALPQNIGFAAGVNRGIQVARGEFVVLLNNDTVVEPDWLENLSTAIADYPDVSIFASKLLNYFNRGVIDSAGDAMDLALGPYKIGEYQPSGLFSDRQFIFGACGGGGCYRRTLFDQIGLFDEDFFAYFEDVDLSFRANWFGYRTLMVPNAVIYHKVAATSGGSPAMKDRFDIMRRRNFIFLVIKNYPMTFLFRYVPFIFSSHSLKFLITILRGRLNVAFMTQWEIIKGLHKMLAKRHSIMAGRRISNTKMKSLCHAKYGDWWGFVQKKIGFGSKT